MKTVTVNDLKDLYVPSSDSHKGQNGRLLIIGGSHLFHAASLWALTVASRIVDLVHYSSVPENNEIVQKTKKEFRNGIVVPRSDLDAYIEEDDCILIGPGMERDRETETLTNSLLKKYPNKQWVIDAGALQMLDVALIPRRAVLTPHCREFEDLVRRAEVGTLGAGPASQALRSAHLWSRDGQGPDLPGVSTVPGAKAVAIAAKRYASPRLLDSPPRASSSEESSPHDFAKKYHCIVLLKGEKDIACFGEGCDTSATEVSHPSNTCVPSECRVIEGGNAGMTKGGTGDVLAGLIAALACKNDPVLATIAGSYINKKAGDALYKKVGPYFNATDLANQIPVTMKELL